MMESIIIEVRDGGLEIGKSVVLYLNKENISRVSAAFSLLCCRSIENFLLKTGESQVKFFRGKSKFDRSDKSVNLHIDDLALRDLSCALSYMVLGDLADADHFDYSFADKNSRSIFMDFTIRLSSELYFMKEISKDDFLRKFTGH